MIDPSSGQPLTWERFGLIVASSLVGFFAGLAALRVMQAALDARQ